MDCVTVLCLVAGVGISIWLGYIMRRESDIEYRQHSIDCRMDAIVDRADVDHRRINGLVEMMETKEADSGNPQA